MKDSTIRGYVDIAAEGAYARPLPAYATLHSLHDGSGVLTMDSAHGCEARPESHPVRAQQPQTPRQVEQVGLESARSVIDSPSSRTRQTVADSNQWETFADQRLAILGGLPQP